MPEGAHEIRDEEATRCPGIYVSIEPKSSFLVPELCPHLHVRGSFAEPNVNVLRRAPFFYGLALVIETFKASEPHVAGTLGIFPRKIVLEAVATGSDEEVKPAVKHWLTGAVLDEGNGQVLLWVIRVHHRQFGTHHHEEGERRNGRKERNEDMLYSRRDLPLGGAIGVVKEAPVGCILVDVELKGRPGKDIRKAKYVTEELEHVGAAIDRKLGALLGGPGKVPTLLDELSVVQVPCHGVKLDGHDHLCPREVEVPAHVVSVLPVNVAGDAVRNGKQRHEVPVDIGWEEEEASVGDECGDNLEGGVRKGARRGGGAGLITV